MTNHDEKSHKLRWITPIALTIALMVAVPTGMAFRTTATGSLSGRVEFKGKPVTIGTVVVAATDGTTYTADISDGQYAFAKLPTGKVQLAVVSRNPERAKMQRDRLSKSDRLTEVPIAVKSGTWVALPERFEQPMQSGLETTLKGPTTYDIRMD